MLLWGQVTNGTFYAIVVFPQRSSFWWNISLPWAADIGTGRTRCFYACDNVIIYHTVRYFLANFWLLVVFNIQKQPYKYGTCASRLLKMIPDPQVSCQDYYSSATYVIGNLLWGYVWILSYSEFCSIASKVSALFRPGMRSRAAILICSPSI